MVDCPLFGNIKGDNWPSSHHDFSSLLLGNSHQAVSIHPEKLISCFKASILPGRASLNHRLDVDAKTFLSHTFGGHYA